MKLLHVNTHDVAGGAAIAAYRLHTALRQTGVDSHILVQDKKSDEDTIIGPRPGMDERLARFRPYFDRHLMYLYPGRDRKSTWSINCFPHGIAAKINTLNPDIVHLHWIGFGFVPASEIKKIRQPVVWTLHDMWAFTGGCHYAGSCEQYLERCGRCPQLGSQRKFDLSSFVWKRKSASWKNLDLTIITPSRWLAECAKSSSLFRNRPVEIIPNGIDTTRFRPIEKAFARNELGLPAERKLILFGAMNPTRDKRKGFQYLESALKIISAKKPSLKPECIIFGRTDGAPVEIPGYRIHDLGNVPGDERLALLYAAADVFVAPSIQENLANTVMESMACGTPVVAFHIGGMPDMIGHRINGYLVKPFDPLDLAEGISWILSDDQSTDHLSKNAREKVVRDFDHESIANQYSRIYQKVLDERLGLNISK